MSVIYIYIENIFPVSNAFTEFGMRFVNSCSDASYLTGSGAGRLPRIKKNIVEPTLARAVSAAGE